MTSLVVVISRGRHLCRALAGHERHGDFAAMGAPPWSPSTRMIRDHRLVYLRFGEKLIGNAVGGADERLEVGLGESG